MQDQRNTKHFSGKPDKPMEVISALTKTEREDAEAKALNKPFVLGLLFGSVLLFGALLLILWALPSFGAELFPPFAKHILLFAIAAIFLAALVLCGTIAFALTTGKRLPFMHRLRGIMNWVLFPLMRLLGIILRIPKSKVRLAFIRLNNDLAEVSRNRCEPEELLILLPHCIQKSTCPHRLTHNIQSCTRCGACAVGPLLDLGGGTVARQMVKKKRPKCLVAVACHRDLTSGVRDVASLPVYGIVNRRPLGPCIDTSVDVPKVEEAILMFLEKQNRSSN